MVTGPSGAGTTRIVEELVRLLEEAGLAEGLRLPPTGAGAAARLRAAWSTWFPPGSAPDLFRWELVSGLARDRGQAPDSCRVDAAEPGFEIVVMEQAGVIGDWRDLPRVRVWSHGIGLVLRDELAAVQAAPAPDVAALVDSAT